MHGYSELKRFNPVAKEVRRSQKQGLFHIHATNVGARACNCNDAFETPAALRLPDNK